MCHLWGTGKNNFTLLFLKPPSRHTGNQFYLYYRMQITRSCAFQLTQRAHEKKRELFVLLLSLVVVALLCPTLCDPVDCSLPDSSVLGISSKNTGVGSHSLLHGIFLTQGSNLLLPNWLVGSLPSETPGMEFSYYLCTLDTFSCLLYYADSSVTFR